MCTRKHTLGLIKVASVQGWLRSSLEGVHFFPCTMKPSEACDLILFCVEGQRNRTECKRQPQTCFPTGQDNGVPKHSKKEEEI